MDLPLDLDVLRGTLRAHGVVFALMFGSHAEGSPRDGADVDLAVWRTETSMTGGSAGSLLTGWTWWMSGARRKVWRAAWR